MGKFEKFIELKEYSSSATKLAGDVVGNTSLSSNQQNALSIAYKILNVALSRYKTRTLDFFRRLTNNDEEIRQLYDELTGELSSLRSGTDKIVNRMDKVVPNNADNGYSNS